MDLDELHAFLAVAEHGSYLAAAQRIRISRSTLRRRVAALEGRTGVPILETTRDGIELTEAGRLLVEHGQRISADVAGLLEATRTIGQEPRGELRLLVPPGLPATLKASWIGIARQTFADLRFTILESSRPLTESLRDVDVVLLFSTGVPDCPANWKTARLMGTRVQLWAHPDYLARRGPLTDARQITDDELLLWSGLDDDPPALQLLDGRRLPRAPLLQTPDINAIFACAADGFGIAFAPRERALEPPGLWPSLVPVLPDQVGRDIGMWFAIAPTRARSPKVSAAVDHIRRMIDRLLDRG